jgi:hypothetical protein
VAKWRPIHAPVSPAPSKIPYGGFSPVRLQTSISVQPSSDHRCQTYMHVPSSSGIHPLLCPVIWAKAQPDAPNTESEHSSSGPWLPNRLFCPVRSSLTMTTSAPLSAARPAYELFRRAAVMSRQPQRVPNLLYQSFMPCRRLYSGGSSNCLRRSLHYWSCLRQERSGSATTSSHHAGPSGACNGAAAFTSCYGLAYCSPCSGQGFYDRACMGLGYPNSPRRL